ncbi:MAG: hypothetical protein LBL17_04480 [Coxiellaceae bacterium]|jgi:predicted membrane metal-binding protein|nr:hypothetical protein [Coxiellaceae bacterium]
MPFRATGYVVNSEANRILSSCLYRYPLTRLRQFLIHKIEEVLGNNPLTPIVIAFVTGAGDRIMESHWRVMRDTGTSYLVAFLDCILV